MNNTHRTPRILVVEDDPDERTLMCEALTLHYRDAGGTDIVAVASAAECLRQDLARFDVVLQDYHLPDMPGLVLLERILARADLPVVIVTGEHTFETAAEAIGRGAQDYVVKFGDYLFAIPLVVDKNIRLHQIKKENQRLQGQLQSMLKELQSKNDQLQASLVRMQEMAAMDHLTGLANRRTFSQTLQREHGQALRYGHDLTCAMCDLDHYKQLNDTFGHQVGDEVLIAAAQVIRSSLRVGDAAARYGGDEFVLLLPHASIEQARDIGERIRRQVAEAARRIQSLGRPVTMSIGLASLLANQPASADVLVSLADRALYQAKDAGKDCIVASAQAAPAPTPA